MLRTASVPVIAVTVGFCSNWRLRADPQLLCETEKAVYLDCLCLASLTSSIGLANITKRPRLVDEIPCKDCRLVLVHPVGDGVDTVGHSFLMVLVQGDDFWVGVELFWVFTTCPEDIAIQPIICPPVVCECQDDLGTSFVCISYDLIQSFEGLLVVLACEEQSQLQ